MNISNERYKVSFEFNFKPKIPTEKVKKIFGLDSLTGPGYLKPEGYRKGLCFTIREEMIWVTMSEDKPSVVKAYHMTCCNIPGLIRKVGRLPTENLVITVYSAKTSTIKLVLTRGPNSYWEISNGYRSAVLEKSICGYYSRSSNSEILRDYISEV